MFKRGINRNFYWVKLQNRRFLFIWNIGSKLKKKFKKKVQHYYVVERLMGVLLTTLAVRWRLSHPSDPSPKFMPTRANPSFTLFFPR